MVSAVVVLGDRPDAALEQRLAALRVRRNTLDDLLFICVPEALEAYRAALPHVSLAPLPHSLDGCTEAYVFTGSGLGGPIGAAAALRFPDTMRVYVVSAEGGINLFLADGTQRSLDAIEYPFVDAHVFNRLAQPHNYIEGARSYVFFPYGFLYRCLGLGPIDAFGFRIDKDVGQLSSREPKHKLITVFGGSSTFSVYCLHHQMFTSVMEALLNEASRSRGLDLTFTVLNFGQNSHVVLNQMLAYQLFCQRLKPDVVISHDGHNDLMWGQINDPYLVERGIVYPHNMEDWAALLHKGEAPSMPALAPAIPVINPPQRVVRAYVERKRQFADLVASSGTQFVWGVQPLIWAKNGYSEAEAEAFKHWAGHRELGAAIRNLPRLYAMLTSDAAPAGSVYADVHRHFSSFPPEETLFADHVHTQPAGDAVIARFYANAIVDLVEGGRLRAR